MSKPLSDGPTEALTGDARPEVDRAFPLPRSGRFDDLMKASDEIDGEGPQLLGPAAGNAGRY